MRQRLVVIGGGNMAGAIVRGAIAARVLVPGDVCVCEPDEAKRRAFEAIGVRATASHASALSTLGADGQVLLAVKPQLLGEVAGQMRPHWPAGAQGPVVITILAGTPTTKVRAAVGGSARVVRAMPNLPASIGAGATAICAGDGAAEGDDAFALRLFEGVGPVVVRIDEDLMDAFTAVAGSGPAYLFYLAEAMAEAAGRMGFDAATADRMVRQTLLGAAQLLAQSEQPAAALRAAVTSRKGTTDAAITHMESRAVRGAVVEALERARDRGGELAKE